MTADDRALVDRFLDMMAAEAGASRHTLAAYRNDLERAAEGLGGSMGRRLPPRFATLGEQWSELAPSTVARRSAAIRRFFGFLVDEGLRADDPSAALPSPRFERPLPRILDEPEVEAMFREAEDRAASGEVAAVRNLALLELLYGSGLRASELVSLPRGALRKGQPFLIVRGKGTRSGWCRSRRVPKWRWNAGSNTSRATLYGCSRAASAISAGCGCSRSSAGWRRTRGSLQRGQPPRPSARLRDASVVGRRRPSRASIAARSRRHRDHPDLHPCRQRAAGRAGQHPPPARRASLTAPRLRLTRPAQC